MGVSKLKLKQSLNSKLKTRSKSPETERKSSLSAANSRLVQKVPKEKRNPVSQQQTQDSFKKSRNRKKIQFVSSKLKTRSKSPERKKKSSLSAANSRLVQKVSKQKENPVCQQQTQDSFKKSRKKKEIQSLSSKLKTRSKSLETERKSSFSAANSRLVQEVSKEKRNPVSQQQTQDSFKKSRKKKEIQS